MQLKVDDSKIDNIRFRIERILRKCLGKLAQINKTHLVETGCISFHKDKKDEKVECEA